MPQVFEQSLFLFHVKIGLLFKVRSFFQEGSAYALNMVSTFARSHSAAMGAGCRDNLETYIMLTGKQ